MALVGSRIDAIPPPRRQLTRSRPSVLRQVLQLIVFGMRG
jgi:hypothetical protein